MAYFNDADNKNIYPATIASNEVEVYPFLNQGSTTEELGDRAYNFLVDHWGMAGQPSLPVGSSANIWETASYESLDLVASYVAQTDCYGQPSHSDQYWPAVGHQVQPHRTGFLSQDDSLAEMLASETSTMVPAPSSVPFDYWGENQSGPSTSTFSTQNVQPLYQPSTGANRTGLISTARFQPYGMSHSRTNEYGYAEAGPSTMVPQSVPYVGLPTLQPSGGISETTADAESNQTNTEEDKAPTIRPKLPRGQGPRRRHRIRMQADGSKLCEWVRRWAGFSKLPSLNKALAVAAGIIPTLRPVEYQEPRLVRGHGKRTAEDSTSANQEFERRNVERSLFRELSRYYRLRQGQNAWARPSLLSLVANDLEEFSPLPGPSNVPPP